MEEFYNKIHTDLAQRYSLTPSQVKLIRSQTLGEKMQEEELIEWLRFKLHPANKRSHPKEFYQRIIQFMTDATPLVWQEITSPLNPSGQTKIPERISA